MSASKTSKPTPDAIFETNRRARFDYEIESDFEAGIVLSGSEVKAIRERRISLKEAYCAFVGDELFLMQAHISEYVQAHGRNHPAIRHRKLLLHRKELDKLHEKCREQGMTIVPLRMYLRGRNIKLEIGVARGKKLHDKRHAIKERDQKREMDRAKRDYRS